MRMLRDSMCEMNRSDIGVLSMQQPHHLFLGDAQDHARRDRRRGSHAERLTRQTALAEEVARLEHGDYGFPAGLRQH